MLEHTRNAQESLILQGQGLGQDAEQQLVRQLHECCANWQQRCIGLWICGGGCARRVGHGRVRWQKRAGRWR